MPGHLCNSLSRPMSFLCPAERSRRTLVPTESSPPPPCPSLQGWRHARDVSGIGAVRDFNASRSCAGRPIQPVPCFETPSRQAVCALDVQQQNHDDARQPTSQRSATSPLGAHFYPATPEVTLGGSCVRCLVRGKLRRLGGHKSVIPSLPSSLLNLHSSVLADAVIDFRISAKV